MFSDPDWESIYPGIWFHVKNGGTIQICHKQPQHRILDCCNLIAHRFVNIIQRYFQLPPVRPCGGIRYNINPTGARSKGENSIWTGIRGAAGGRRWLSAERVPRHHKLACRHWTGSGQLCLFGSSNRVDIIMSNWTSSGRGWTGFWQAGLYSAVCTGRLGRARDSLHIINGASSGRRKNLNKSSKIYKTTGGDFKLDKMKYTQRIFYPTTAQQPT